LKNEILVDLLNEVAVKSHATVCYFLLNHENK